MEVLIRSSGAPEKYFAEKIELLAKQNGWKATLAHVGTESQTLNITNKENISYFVMEDCSDYEYEEVKKHCLTLEEAKLEAEGLVDEYDSDHEVVVLEVKVVAKASLKVVVEDV